MWVCMTTTDKRMTFYWEGERALHVIWTVLSGVPPRQINCGFLIFLDLWNVTLCQRVDDTNRKVLL